MFAAECFGQLVHVPVQQVHQFHHDPRAALGVGCSPFGLCGLGMGNGLCHFICIGQRAFRLHFAGGGVHHIGKATRGPFDMFAVDIVG